MRWAGRAADGPAGIRRARSWAPRCRAVDRRVWRPHSRVIPERHLRTRPRGVLSGSVSRKPSSSRSHRLRRLRHSSGAPHGRPAHRGCHALSLFRNAWLSPACDRGHHGRRVRRASQQTPTTGPRAGLAGGVCAVVGGWTGSRSAFVRVTAGGPQRIYVAATCRATLAEVGMSGGFCHIVLRLVETGYTPPFSAARTIPTSDHFSAWETSYRQDRRGQPATSGCGPVGATENGRKRPRSKFW